MGARMFGRIHQYFKWNIARDCNVEKRPFECTLQNLQMCTNDR